MFNNIKRSGLNKFITAVVLLAVLSFVYIILQRGRTSEPQNEVLVTPPVQSVDLSERQGDQFHETVVSETKTPPLQLEQPEPKTPQSNMDQFSEQLKTLVSQIESSQSSSDIRLVNSTLMEMLLVHKVDPVYPEAAKSERLSDTVSLSVTINEKGTVTETSVIRGNPVFADVAIEAVSQWRYEPFLIDEAPTPVRFGVSITFRPDEAVSTRPGAVGIGELIGNHVNFITDDPLDTSVRAELMPTGSQRYEGREYHTVSPEMSAAVVRIDKQLLRETAYAGWADGDDPKNLFRQPVVVHIYINENGKVDGIMQLMGPQNAEFHKELMNLRIQSPAGFNGKAVPSRFMLNIDVPSYVK